MISGNDVCFLHQLFITFLTAGGSVPVISVTPSTLNVIEGEEALFECLAVGDPTPTIRRSREKGRLSSSSSSENGVLIISSTKLEDAETYFCRAANKFGAKAELVTLNVEKGIIKAPIIRIRKFLSPQLFLCEFGFCPHRSDVSGIRIRLPEWRFLNTLWIRHRGDANSRYVFIQWRHNIEPSSLPWIFKTMPSAMGYRFHTSWTSDSSHNLWTVKPSMITWDLCQTAARHFEASFQVGRTNLDTVNKLKRAK